MGNSSSFTINIKALFDASDVKNSLGNIQSALNGLKLPANVTKGLQDTFSKLSAEVKNFEVLSGKGVKDSGDFKRVETSVNKIITLYEKLKVEAKDLGGIDISKLFPTSIVDTISKANAALDAYQKKVASASNEVEKANKKLAEWQSRLTARQTTRDERSNDLSKAQEQLAKAEEAIQNRTGIHDIAEAWKQIQDMANQAAEAAKKYANVEQSTLTSGQKSVITKANNLQQLVDNYRNAGEAVKVAQSALSAANANVTKATNQVRDLTQAVKDAETTPQEAEAGALQTLLTDLSKLDGIDLSNYEASFKGAASAVEDFINKNGSAAKGQVEGIIAILEKEGISVDGLRAKLEEASIESQRFNERMRDIGAFKSRIQYFFGLNNVINLFKRGIQQAVDTIKDLDKAMTETAVVTDFTVSDMWKQLPEYTKRANELGVTTQQAYESATLFYQQGLNTQQAAALSTETLKMARIAGLDAAEATDRMTNALRGFNMELDAQSAQRVDDVYSQLAAHTASNVDEISTAMTKVASLAHSANMEFETTAAFLAQIIETTRESAETAGTALKTVVARFSEVKKLYSEDQLQGTDEEGQVIDVNKIGVALRTAGIDLNKYFLGEVGLDDIFIELASKWDTLTSVQQRYIATQAAGSRQQSRFIALMQDYARTQELVGMAYDANGASAKQFEKTQDSLQSKLARLKNAWDEFLMGITNSSVIKGMVDALTTLLNVLNQITSAFGDSASGILKLVTAATALAGLKSLFKNGGIFDSILMNITGGNIFKAQVAEAGDIFISKVTGAALTNTTGAGATGIGGAFAGVGGALGIAAIVAAVMAAIVAIEHFTDEGVTAVRKAKKAVEKQEKVVNESHELNKKQKDAYDSYIENQKIAQTTTNKDEKLAAEAAMQDAAQILQTIDVKNVIHTEAGLAIDETYVQQRQKELEKEEQYEQALLDFEEARQKYAENLRLDELTYDSEKVQWGDKAVQALLNGTVFGPFLNYMSGKANNENSVVGGWIREKIPIYSTRPTGGSWWDWLVNPQYGKSEKELEQKINDQNAQNASTQRQNNIIYQQKISSGAEALLHQQGIEEKIAKTVADAYVQIVDQVEFSTKDSTQIKNELSSLAEIAASENGKLILDIINGSYEKLISSSELHELYKTLPDEYKTTLQQLTNTNNRTILSFLSDQAKQLTKSQSTFRKNVINNLSKAGVKNSILLDQVQNNLSLTELKKLDELRTTFADYSEAFNDTLLTSISDTMLDNKWTDSDLEIFTNKLSDNPVLTLQAITNEANNANSSIRDLAQQLLTFTEKDSSFSMAGQMQYYFASDEYTNLASAIKEVSDASGNISADGITKLAEQSKTLNALLKQGTMSANGLANALSLMANGKLGFNQLTNAVLDALDHLYTFDSLVRDVHDFIANFDEGIDYGEGIDFLTDKAEELTKLLDNWEFGNQRSKNLYEMLFGTNYMEDWAKGDAYIKNRVTEMQNWLKNDGYNFFEAFSGKLGIKAKGKGNVEWDILSQFNDIEDMYTQVANMAKISKDAAKMLIEGFASHGDYDFVSQLGELSQKGVINSIVGKYAKGKTLWRESDLQAIADSLGIELDTLKEKIQKAIDKAGLDGSAFEAPKTFKNGDLLKEFKQNLTLSDQDFSSFINDFVNNRQLDETHLRAALSNMGYAGDEMNALIEEIKANLKETEQIDDIETNPDVNVNPEVNVAEGYSDDVTNSIIDATPENIDVDVPVNINPVVQDWSNFNVGDTSHDDAVAKGMKILTALNEQRDAVLSQVKNQTNDFNVQIVPELDTSQLNSDSLTNLVEVTPKINTDELEKTELDPIQVQTEVDNSTIYSSAEDAANYLYEQISSGESAAAAAGGAEVSAQLNNGVNASDVESLLAAKLIAGASGSAPSISAIVTQAVSGQTYRITVYADVQGLPSGSGALGGLVKSFARGSADHFLQPGFALTGEEGPEIVWNKEKGYAYVTGRNGAEFQNLQPGDRVFNAAETSRIFRNSSFAKGGKFESFASGRWKVDDSGSGGSGGGSGSSNKDEDNEWKNEIDWLYNVVQNIEELERQQNILQEEYDDLLTDQTKTGQDLYKMLIKQLGNLYAQLDHQTYALEKREQEMREFMDTTNDKDEYLWYNWNDRTIEIDWDKIDQITDEEEYNHIKELIDQAEDIQDKMDDAEDAIIDINNSIQDLENIWRDTFVDFEDRVLKAVIKMYQTVIDNYSELNDTLNDSNTAILDAINKEISLQRQIRDNTKTEEEIANDEAQLAYLRRDTTGGNDLAALQLEKELNDQRQNYEDNLIDQAVQRLQDDNDAAAQQREKQIEIMQAQLDYQSENGEFNQYIRDLMDTAIDGDGHLATDSDLYKLLAEQENADAMTKVGREVWEEELNGTFKEVMAFLLKEQGEAEGTYFTAVTAAFQGVQDQFDKFYHGSYSQGSVHVGSNSSSSGGGSGGGSNNSTKPAAKPTPVAMPTIELTVKAEDPVQRIKGSGSTALKGVKVKGGWVTYGTGGLADSTGPAWLDGTKNAPEYVLNAKQTDAFLRLADVLPAAMNNTGSSVSNTFGATTNNIVINVDKIDSDYSVDQMVARVKESLFESGSYRNNNVLNFLR